MKIGAGYLAGKFGRATGLGRDYLVMSLQQLAATE